MRIRAFKTPPQRREVLTEAMSVALHVYCDKLDCSESFARQPTDKTPEWVLDRALSVDSHFHFIERDDSCGRYFDVGLSTLMGSPDYFLWIKVSIEEGERLIEKYNLEPLF
jgi:hypothetical protein